MSQENVEIVRHLFELFHIGMETGHLGAWTESEDLADEFEWIMPPGIPGLGVYRGREGFVEFQRIWTEDFEECRSSWSKCLMLARTESRVSFIKEQLARRVERPSSFRRAWCGSSKTAA